MATISTLAVNLIARSSVFNKNIKKSRKVIKDFKKSLGRVATSAKRFGSILKRVTAPALGILSSGLRTVTRLAKIATVAFIGITAASVKIAVDVQETDNLFKISMGNMAKQAQKFATDYSKSLGLFENDTRKALGTFQLMLTSMGLTEKASFDMSKGLVKLVNDIASFRNQKPEDIFLKLQAGITGESEPLKRLGILVNETVIKNLALKDATIKARVSTQKFNNVISAQVNGMVKVAKAARKQTLVLTDAEKVMLRYKAIVNATEKDQGDMKRTMDDTANVFRVIAAQIKVTANTIGKVFLPEVTKAAIVVRQFFINNQARIKVWAETAKKAITVVVDKLKEYFALARAGNFAAIFKDIGRIFGSLIKGVIALFERIKPVAFELGSQIAAGFIKSVEGTKLGKLLEIPGEVKSKFKAPAALVRAQNETFLANELRARSRLLTEKLRGRGGPERAGGLEGPERARFPEGPERDAIIQELRTLNRQMQKIVQTRDF